MTLRAKDEVMRRSEGRLWYSEDMRFAPGEPEHYRLVVDVDPGIAWLARALVPLVYGVKPQRWPAHITVARKEVLPSDAAKFQGTPIEFEYDPLVRNDDTYWWLDVYCPQLSEIRVQLGLPPSTEWTRPPDGRDCFHTTIGNTKR